MGSGASIEWPPAIGMPADAQTAAPPQDLANDLDRKLAERHTENGERHDWAAAHRVNIRDGVRRGDAPEVEGIVYDRREKVGGSYYAGICIKLPHRSIVAGLDSNEELREERSRGLVCEQLLQD